MSCIIGIQICAISDLMQSNEYLSECSGVWIDKYYDLLKSRYEDHKHLQDNL